ncbi:glycosyltransferase involved in cell wall biosynthesis [Neobacillus niacini]|uniref:glycosyltransferase family 4 protein n=1 Tax=Neobacillus driksii TaxID=3035913 RepID=UPI00277FE470|nr:glycosyltransferase family 4 protein [Neobacillus niacini]MDQ0970531.1 glycosyltransferase involved in cell wall biosynthesis [Neobacillus niacini]
MKILLATYWPIPHVGGVWSYMVQLKKKLESLGHEVDMLGYDEDNISVHIVNENRKVDSDKLLPLLNAKLNAQTYPAIYANDLVKYTEFHRYVYELSAAYLGLEKYDVIHTQDVISTASIDRVRPEKSTLIATLHGSVAHEVRHQLKTIHKSNTSYMARVYYDELERLGATSAEVTIVANEWLKNILTNEFQVPNEQIKILHYGFDTENFIKRSKEKSSILRPKNKKVIIYSGRLVELKGVHHLIAALSELKKVRKDWVCWIVGNGDYQEELKVQRKVLGLEDDILFFGKREDIPYLLANSDIFVLPSLLENQPLSVIEAQIAGKAIIVSDVGGLPEMVEDGVTGLVTPAGDTKTLYKKINLLLDDEKYRKRLGSNAKKWGMTHWSMDKGVKELTEIYKSAISESGKGENNGASDHIN